MPRVHPSAGPDEVTPLQPRNNLNATTHTRTDTAGSAFTSQATAKPIAWLPRTARKKKGREDKEKDIPGRPQPPVQSRHSATDDRHHRWRTLLVRHGEVLLLFLENSWLWWGGERKKLGRDQKKTTKKNVFVL